MVIEAPALIVETEELVVHLELRCDVVGALVVLGQVGRGHRVDEFLLVVVEHRRGALQHLIIGACVASIGILLIDAHVRHLAVGDREEVVVVALVLGVGQREVGGNLDAIAHIVVESHTCREAVELLLYDRTGLIVETARDTERSLLTTTGDGEEVVLTQTDLRDGVAPVGVVVILLILRERGVVVELTDVGRTVVLLRVEVCLLEQHGVVVTAEELVTLWLIGSCEAERVAHAGLTLATTFGDELNHTVGTLRTIDGCCGGVFQYGDRLNILGVDVEKLCKLLVVGRVDIEVAHVNVPRVSVDHDEGV